MVWKPKQSDRMYRAVVRAGLLTFAALRLRVDVTGTEHLPAPDPLQGRSRRAVPGRGAVVAITHFGYLDFAFAELVLWKHARVQMRYMITKAAASHPVIGPIVYGLGHVVTDRRAGAEAYADALAKLRAGEYVAILPEAGVSRSYTVRELKTGAVRLAAEAGVPIIPVSVWGSHRLLTRGHGFSLRRAWRSPVRIHVSEPIRQTPDADVAAETEQLRAELQDGIERCIETFPLVPAPGEWWQPAHLGGGAMTEAERAAADAHDLATGRYSRG
ncbi:MAG: Acyl-CoA:1-acyl-sn-glycerol-3-phosphate acyltransferase [uncultured Arthrobacter sp.]|uniref:Acyl-CoA:1-acyl-sn-glycerol-3-phosphate acyltransferase n=1 Tax=uncultured Arthrobacter sp. TaxID=114050 RepID=A0A6J4J5B8_9MICC|nr:lysophospholipid acyltransferase family protein [uncultured Arthrobacter sp.]CAA9268783.1 MAG: Acyl-CoA:1-acyl-sn-glycerol-3-phosphate acyltransferase [uncultured Arthrobacter sp.]